MGQRVSGKIKRAEPDAPQYADRVGQNRNESREFGQFFGMDE
jgi:hypothetical protein